MENMPKVNLGIIAVSRDCFPMSLSISRREAVVAEYTKTYGEIYECKTTVENEVDMRKALAEVNEAGCNALVVFLGNFGPESSEILLVKEFAGPSMVVAAAEEAGDKLCDDRSNPGVFFIGINDGKPKMMLPVLHVELHVGRFLQIILTLVRCIVLFQCTMDGHSIQSRLYGGCCRLILM